MVVVSAGVVACGLMMIGSVGPNPAGADSLGELVATPDTSPTTTPTTTPTTPTTTPTTTHSVPRPSPVPLSVSSPSQGPDGVVVVGAGNSISIEGTCWVVDGQPLGPVELWVINGSAHVIKTGLRAAHWTFDWTAPTQGGVVAIQAWCGDPATNTGGYPLERQLAINIVEVAPPPTKPTPPTVTPTSTTVGSHAPAGSIPETG